MNYSKVVIPYLIENSIKITTAESCTGGLIASSIVAYPGVSAIYDIGHVTYANSAKEAFLDVPEDILKLKGAVSKETAFYMALGAKKNANSDISIVTTGIAGPDGGTKNKPVGLIYIGMCYKNKVYVRKYIFKGNRTLRRLQATNEAFRMIYEICCREDICE